MNAIGWSRASAVSVVLLTGCGEAARLDEIRMRPFDAAIDCRPESAPVLSTLEEAIAVLDADGDGALTDTDLRPGETAVILALTGTHTATGEVSDSGFTIHQAWDSFLYAYPSADYAYWGVEVVCNCLPMLSVFVNFENHTLPAATLAEGDFELRGIGIDVLRLEMTAADGGTMDATGHLTGAVGDRASGYMTGFGNSRLMRIIPEKALTGQQLSLEAFAFRDILNRQAD